MLKKLGTIDRRYIYIIIVLCIVIPFLTKTILPIEISPPVRSAYEAIEKLQEGSYIMVSIDYEAASEPELQPMLIAILHHAFKRNLKVILMGHWPLGIPLGEDALTSVSKEYNKKYGVDYVNLGYRPGVSAVILGIGKEIRDFFKADYKGISIDSIPMMNVVHNYNDISLLVGLEAGATGDLWVQLAGAQFGEKIILGCTAVVAPDAYPYIQAGQIEGLIGGLKGASEYETLVGIRGRGIIGMTAQSVAHIAIIIFIILGNLGYFMLRKK